MPKKKVEPPLNEKQLTFCQEYIIDFNLTQAAIRAGYSERSATVTASRLYAKANIQKEISRLTKERASRTQTTADEVLLQLKKIAFMDIKDVVDWGIEKRPLRGRDGKPMLDDDGTEKVNEIYYVRPVDIDKVDGTLIQSVKLGKHGFEIHIPDRMRAFEMLGRHLGLGEIPPEMTVNIKPYAEALKKAAEATNLWDGFDNGGGTDGQG